MATRNEREKFIADMTKEGMSLEAAQKMMRYATTLHRLAELEASSEAADRDRVPCPGAMCSVCAALFRKLSGGVQGCAVHGIREATCLCIGYGDYDHETRAHGKIPRIAVRAWRTQERAAKLAKESGMEAIFQGDPRGAAIKLKVPSGRTDDWGQTGICVP